MSTVEAAASLFYSDGESGSGPDPFAVIGSEATDTTPPHDEDETHISSHSFQMGQDTSSWFAEQMYPDVQQDQHDPWFIPTTQDPSSGEPHHPSGLPSPNARQQRYYPGVNAYEPHSAYNSSPGQCIVRPLPLLCSLYGQQSRLPTGVLLPLTSRMVPPLPFIINYTIPVSTPPNNLMTHTSQPHPRQRQLCIHLGNQQGSSP